MASFKKTRDVLFQSYDQGLISEDELIVLLEENTARNLQFNYASYDRFDLGVIDNPEGIWSTRLRANSPTPTCLRLLVNSPK